MIRMIDIPFCLVRQCDENAHDALKSFIDKYKVSDEIQEHLNEVPNR